MQRPNLVIVHFVLALMSGACGTIPLMVTPHVRAKPSAAGNVTAGVQGGVGVYAKPVPSSELEDSATTDKSQAGIGIGTIDVDPFVTDRLSIPVEGTVVVGYGSTTLATRVGIRYRIPKWDGDGSVSLGAGVGPNLVFYTLPETNPYPVDGDAIVGVNYDFELGVGHRWRIVELSWFTRIGGHYNRQVRAPFTASVNLSFAFFLHRMVALNTNFGSTMGWAQQTAHGDSLSDLASLIPLGLHMALYIAVGLTFNFEALAE